MTASPGPATGDRPRTGASADGGARPGLSDADLAAVAAQLGRFPRGAIGVAHRCGCGLPDVVETTPRLPDGTPFPTTYYLTCPRAVAECSRLESAGVMNGMTARLATDEHLSARYRAAHDDYLARRRAIGEVPEIDGVSAGGMPDRVKCLHVQLGHTLAAGGGINPIGDETLALVPPWWRGGPCVSPGAEETAQILAGGDGPRRARATGGQAGPGAAGPAGPGAAGPAGPRT